MRAKQLHKPVGSRHKKKGGALRHRPLPPEGKKF